MAFAFAQIEDEDTSGLNQRGIAKGCSQKNPDTFGFVPVVHAATGSDQGVDTV